MSYTTLSTKHNLQLTNEDVNVLITSYTKKLNSIVRPLQKYETGLAICNYKKENGLLEVSEVNFRNRMNDHNYRVTRKSEDPILEIVCTKKYRNPYIYKEWYLTEIRQRYNDIREKIYELAEIVGYDCTHLKGQLNFSELEQKSMREYRKYLSDLRSDDYGWED